MANLIAPILTKWLEVAERRRRVVVRLAGRDRRGRALTISPPARASRAPRTSRRRRASGIARGWPRWRPGRSVRPTIVSAVSDSPSSTHAAIELTTGMHCVISEPNHASTCRWDQASSTWPIAPAPSATTQIQSQSIAVGRQGETLPGHQREHRHQDRRDQHDARHVLQRSDAGAGSLGEEPVRGPREHAGEREEVPPRVERRRAGGPDRDQGHAHERDRRRTPGLGVPHVRRTNGPHRS